MVGFSACEATGGPTACYAIDSETSTLTHALSGDVYSNFSGPFSLTLVLVFVASFVVLHSFSTFYPHSSVTADDSKSRRHGQQSGLKATNRRKYPGSEL